MRATLEQLKAMSDDELENYWMRSNFPFEELSGCRHCLTRHGNPEFACSRKEHAELRRQVTPLRDKLSSYLSLRLIVEELYALRLFYDSLYPPSDEAPSPAEAVAEDTARTEVVT